VENANASAQNGSTIEWRQEAFTMAFYVSICLLAALAAVGETAQVDVFKIVWGTTVGLALVHWFAFRLSARLVGGGGFGREDAELAAAQLAGALAIAMIASVPVLLFPDSAELDVARMRLAALIAVAGFAVARASGAGMGKSAAYARGHPGHGRRDRLSSRTSSSGTETAPCAANHAASTSSPRRRGVTGRRSGRPDPSSLNDRELEYRTGLATRSPHA